MSANDIFSNSELQVIKTFAAALGMTVAEYVRHVTLEQIEDKLDLQELREAKAEAEADPGVYTMEEIAKKYGFKKDV